MLSRPHSDIFQEVMKPSVWKPFLNPSELKNILEPPLIKKQLNKLVQSYLMESLSTQKTTKFLRKDLLTTTLILTVCCHGRKTLTLLLQLLKHGVLELTSMLYQISDYQNLKTWFLKKLDNGLMQQMMKGKQSNDSSSISTLNSKVL
jgi:hypothetical protein